MELFVNYVALNSIKDGEADQFESTLPLNTSRPRQNGRHFPEAIFKWIFLNENVWISIKISLKFAPRGPINNIPALVQIMAWRQTGESHYLNLTHICVTQPQWVKDISPLSVPHLLHWDVMVIQVAAILSLEALEAALHTRCNCTSGNDGTWVRHWTHPWRPSVWHYDRNVIVWKKNVDNILTTFPF